MSERTWSVSEGQHGCSHLSLVVVRDSSFLVDFIVSLQESILRFKLWLINVGSIDYSSMRPLLQHVRAKASGGERDDDYGHPHQREKARTPFLLNADGMKGRVASHFHAGPTLLIIHGGGG
jgi:hypothetical protein